MRDELYDILKRLIINRDIKPGEKINEDELAKKIWVSRTPIRETFCRFENEGIVKIIPRCGAFVATQSKGKVFEILQVREVLEGLVARLAAQNMDKKTLGKLHECLERISSSPE